MFRNEIRLDTLTDIHEFIKLVSTVSGKVSVEDDDGNRVNGKSLLGMMYASGEFPHKYVVSDTDISGLILKFII